MKPMEQMIFAAVCLTIVLLVLAFGPAAIDTIREFYEVGQ